MLTARAEHRLYLRSDNAVSRLGAKALAAGLLDEEQAALTKQRLADGDVAREALEALAIGVDLGVADARKLPLREWARRREGETILRRRHEGDDAMQEAIDDAVYAPYLERQAGEVAARERDRMIAIRPGFAFESVPGLSSEMIDRLVAVGPATIDEATRIAGVTPAALAALHFALLRAA
jgi:tRNA uridine 5-carboxymethylaminomethyl modification enzyme